jgi:hypothetical protein
MSCYDMGRPADILLPYEVRRKGGRASDKNKRTRVLCQCTRELDGEVWLPVTLVCSADHAITVSTCNKFRPLECECEAVL